MSFCSVRVFCFMSTARGWSGAWDIPWSQYLNEGFFLQLLSAPIFTQLVSWLNNLYIIGIEAIPISDFTSNLHTFICHIVECTLNTHRCFSYSLPYSHCFAITIHASRYGNCWKLVTSVLKSCLLFGSAANKYSCDIIHPLYQTWRGNCRYRHRHRIFLVIFPLVYYYVRWQPLHTARILLVTYIHQVSNKRLKIKIHMHILSTSHLFSLY